MITQKTQYALRAIFELARHYGEGPLKISEISSEQAIPLRFLEVILNKLKKGGFVRGKRGFEWGYFLIRPPEEIRPIDIIRQMDETIGPVHCLSLTSPKPCPLKGQLCVFSGVAGGPRLGVADFQKYDHTGSYRPTGGITRCPESDPSHRVIHGALIRRSPHR